jgi:hypothetical protein
LALLTSSPSTFAPDVIVTFCPEIKAELIVILLHLQDAGLNGFVQILLVQVVHPSFAAVQSAGVLQTVPQAGGAVVVVVDCGAVVVGDPADVEVEVEPDEVVVVVAGTQTPPVQTSHPRLRAAQS